MTPDEVREDFQAIARIGPDPAGGWTRPGWSSAETAAHDWFAARAREIGLSVRQDAFGNTIARRPGRAAARPAVAIGSHLDTVPNGGLYDGALGVVVALEVARRVGQGGCPLEIIVFRDEEGRFGPFTGSRAMMGKLAENVLDTSAIDGTQLREAMRQQGLAPSGPHAARRDPAELACWIELHIEQGPVLETAGLPVGLVTEIAGQSRLNLRFVGQAGHAGALPMAGRRDAFIAAARFAAGFDDLIRAEADGPRGTIGRVEVAPNQGTIVPGEVRMNLEIRDSDPAVLTRLMTATEALARRTAVQAGVTVEAARGFSTAPVPMDADLIACLARSAERAGHPARRIVSGANHDAGILGAHIPAAMLFVPSRDGLSHVPEEHTDEAPILAAIETLERAVAALLEPGPVEPSSPQL
ncbi:Zn-dependent hydrolase [Frigidibacter oleivorans]|uniref:Zn-dependent hydrolase n=1 Tax=Frigidibacter oleivorans TaxID=2487129 RepID=UPI0013DEC7A1|nr:Zn-dependent hydrolase [Frigidibacter oleivorans]